MTEMALSVAEPFTSPAWGSNLAVFSNPSAGPVPEEEVKAYIARACKYARHYGVYLVPESFLLMGYHSMCLISPQGEVLGVQQAAYCNGKMPVRRRGDKLEVLQTEFGGLFLCVDVDIYRPEIPRVAADTGAQYLICSQQISEEDYGTHMVLHGCWNAAQSNSLYVVGVCSRFNCICAPLELTKHRDGFVVPPRLKMPVTARLSAGSLARCAPRFPLTRRFYAVHRDELAQ